MDLIYYFEIYLYNNIPYLYLPPFWYTKSKEELIIHVKTKLDFCIPAESFKDIDLNDKLNIQLKMVNSSYLP